MKLSAFASLFLLHWSFGYARPWEIQELKHTPYAGALVPQLVQELDAWTASLLSHSSAPLVGAGAAIAYLGYAGTMVATGQDTRRSAVQGRSSSGDDLLTRIASMLFQGGSSGNSSNSASMGEDLMTRMVTSVVKDTLSKTKTADAIRRVGGRALQHGASVLRLALNYFSRAVGRVFRALAIGQRALQPDCVAKQMCRIGQMTGNRWPVLGILLRSFDSTGLDHHSQALIDGTTVGDCSGVFHKCPD